MQINLNHLNDVRTIQQREPKNKGIKLQNKADETSSGPASFMLTDLDGNVIYVEYV
jgi:hypothetical protein